MKATKLIAALVLTSVLSSFAYAGWFHLPSSKTTKWTDTPTPATCWTRDYSRNVVWVAQKVLIYEDTPRYYNYAGNADTVDQAYTGYWVPDSDGIIWPRTDLSEAADTDTLRQNIVWMDVEWYMGADRILWVK